MHKSARFLHRLSSLFHSCGLAKADLLLDLGHLIADTGIGFHLGGDSVIAMKDGSMVPTAQFPSDFCQRAIAFLAYQIDGYVSRQGSPLVSIPAGQVVHRKAEMVGHHLQ